MCVAGARLSHSAQTMPASIVYYDSGARRADRLLHERDATVTDKHIRRPRRRQGSGCDSSGRARGRLGMDGGRREMPQIGGTTGDGEFLRLAEIGKMNQCN